MGFRISTWDLPSIRTYQQALNFLDATTSWRGSHEYPISTSRRKKHLRARRVGDGVAFRMYSTDVVTWVSPTEIIIVPYASTSTDMFAWCFLPDGIDTWFSRGNILSVHGTLYRLSGATKLKMCDGRWEIVDSPTKPFISRRLDKVWANAALKAENYAEFRTWYKLASAMAVQGDDLADSRVYEAFHNRDLWPSLMRYPDPLVLVRDAIYKHYDTYTYHSVPTITETEYDSWNAHKWY